MRASNRSCQQGDTPLDSFAQCQKMYGAPNRTEECNTDVKCQGNHFDIADTDRGVGTN